MPCNGTTWAGTLTDHAGTIHVVFCHAYRTVRIGATDHARKAWGITHLAEGFG